MAPSGDVAVVIPARDESDRIRATVAGAAGLPGVDLVLVVDDGSRDDTAAIAQDAGASVLRHSRSRVICCSSTAISARRPATRRH